MKIKTTVFIDSAHKLDLPYESKCNNLHGHRWQVDVEIDGPVNGQTGMIVDFGEIKCIISSYDHRYMNDMVDFNPTAENLAQHWAMEIKEKLPSEARVKVTVFETPKNMAEFEI